MESFEKEGKINWQKFSQLYFIFNGEIGKNLPLTKISRDTYFTLFKCYKGHTFLE